MRRRPFGWLLGAPLPPNKSEHTINLKPVESSNIAAVAYEPADRKLYVQFKRGGIYQYHDVPPEIADNFMACDSIGRYFHCHIKSVYKWKRLTDGSDNQAQAAA